MAKEAKIKVDGVVTKIIHDVYFVELSNKVTIQAHVSGKIRMNLIRILPGDKVTVAMSPYDLKRGMITFRYNK